MDEKSFASIQTRRRFFEWCAAGIGTIAVSHLMSEGASAAPAAAERTSPLAPRPPQFPAKAKNVIFLFMEGAPSQLDLFDYKPRLNEFDGQPIPQSFIEGKRFAFMDSVSQTPMNVLGTWNSLLAVTG